MRPDILGQLAGLTSVPEVERLGWRPLGVGGWVVARDASVLGVDVGGYVGLLAGVLTARAGDGLEGLRDVEVGGCCVVAGAGARLIGATGCRVEESAEEAGGDDGGDDAVAGHIGHFEGVGVVGLLGVEQAVCVGDRVGLVFVCQMLMLVKR